MKTLFGATFAGGATVLVWLVFGQLINRISGVGGQILAMTGFQRDVLIISSVALVIKLLVGFPVARSSGIVGYAVVTSIVTAATNVVFVFCVRWRLGIWTHPLLPTRTAILGSGS